MHRTQIYFEEQMFEELKQRASSLGLSLSAYIRDVLKKDLKSKKEGSGHVDLSEFAGMWKDREIDLQTIRKAAWK